MENTEHQQPEVKTSFSSRIDLSKLQESVLKIKKELKKVIIGQEDFIEFLIVSLLSNGHVLIEGVPGVAKTVTVKLLAKTIQTEFSRIQFTPDLMPSDVLGTSVLNMKTSEFEFKEGPIFSNLVLIDEINRAPAKTQSALFEVMEEQQIEQLSNQIGPIDILVNAVGFLHSSGKKPEKTIDDFNPDFFQLNILF